MLKTLGVRTTFGGSDLEKVHAVVARSKFRSQNAQKHLMCGPLLEVEMSKKCMPLWREAHFQVKSAKNWGARNTFGRSDPVSRGRRKGLGTLSKVSKTWGFCSSFKKRLQAWDIRRGYDWQLQQQLLPQLQLQLHLHYTTLITLQHITTYYNYKYNYNCNHTTLHYTYTTLITLHYAATTTVAAATATTTTTTLHYTTLHYTYYTTRHYTALH